MNDPNGNPLYFCPKCRGILAKQGMYWYCYNKSCHYITLYPKRDSQ